MRKRLRKKLWYRVSKRIISENVKAIRDTMIYGNGFVDINYKARWRNPERCINHVPARDVLPSEMIME